MKTLLWIVVVVVLVVGGGVAYLLLNSGSLIKTAVETLGSQALGVPVSLGSAELSLAEGAAELRGLVVGNPQGFDGPDAFRLGRVRVAVDPTQLSSELVVLRDVQIDSPELGLVAKGLQTNLQALMANLDGGGGDTASSSAPTATGPKLIIDRFSFTNARTTASSDVLGERTATLPDIILQDIGRKSSGITVREALQQILRPILRASTEVLAGQSLDVEGMKAKAAELRGQAEEKLNEALKEQLPGGLDSLLRRPDPN